MSEDKTKETSAPVEAKEEVQEETKQEIKSFNQEQLDNIVQTRIMAERRKYEKKIEFADRANPFATFEGHLKGVLEWKKDPAKFIKELIEKSDEDELHKIIKEKLREGNSNEND